MKPTEQSGFSVNLSITAEKKKKNNLSASNSQTSTCEDQVPDQRCSVTCPECKYNFKSFINVDINSTDKRKFSVHLAVKPVEDEGDLSVSSTQSFTCPEQAETSQKFSLKCPKCKIDFSSYIKFFIEPNNQSGFSVNLSIKEVEKKKKKKNDEDLSASCSQTRVDKEVQKGGRGSLPNLRPTVRFYRIVTGQTLAADDVIMEQVKKKKLPLMQVEETNLEECDVVVLFCPITLRVGSDVQSAMTDQRVSSKEKPVILVLMHHTRDVDYSTAGTKWSEVYHQVELDVHVLYHETHPGLLQCEQNNQAIETIRQQLSKYSK